MPRKTKLSFDSVRKIRAMAWPIPPLAPVIRMTRDAMNVLSFRTHKMSANGLLVAAHDADIGSSMAFLMERVDRQHTLPGSRGHKAFAQDGLRRNPRSRPMLPGSCLRRIQARNVLQTIGQKLIGTIG